MRSRNRPSAILNDPGVRFGQLPLIGYLIFRWRVRRRLHELRGWAR